MVRLNKDELLTEEEIHTAHALTQIQQIGKRTRKDIITEGGF